MPAPQRRSSGRPRRVTPVSGAVSGPSRLLGLILLFSLAAASGLAMAQTARSGGGANAQLMQQLQQLASERTALQAENARMKQELAELTRERDALKNSRAALDRRSQAGEAAIARSEQGRAEAEAEAQRLKDRMQELVAKFRETAQTLQEVEGERATFKQSLTTKETELNACIARNTALYELNDEVLTRFENQGALSRLARLEPFTKLKRVQLENLIDDFRYRAEDQRVSASPSPSSAP